MGGASSISHKDNNNTSKLITFYNMDLPQSQSQQCMRVTEQTTIKNIITYIKEKLGVQHLTLYYESFRIDDNVFLLYEYLDILPNRVFGYRINKAQEQVHKQNTQVVQNDNKQTQSNNQQSQSQVIMGNQKTIQHQSKILPISEQNQQSKTQQNNNGNLSQQKYTSLIVIKDEKNQEIVKKTENPKSKIGIKDEKNQEIVKKTENPKSQIVIKDEKNQEIVKLNENPKSQIIIKDEKNQEIVKQDENPNSYQGDNLKEQNQILNYLLKLTMCKFKQKKEEHDKIQQDYNQIKQNYEILQQENYQIKQKYEILQQENYQIKQQILELQVNDKNKEIQQKSSIKKDVINNTVNLNNQNDLQKQQHVQQHSQIEIKETQTIDKNQKKFKNQCGHYLDEQQIYDIIKQALVNKTIASCDQCKPKLSSNILIKIDSIGKAYKEFQANQEINQLMINLQSQKKHVIYQCSSNFQYLKTILKLLLPLMFAQQHGEKQMNIMKVLKEDYKIQLFLLKNIQSKNLISNIFSKRRMKVNSKNKSK